MNRIVLSLCILLFCAAPAMAEGLDSFLENLNIEADSNRHEAGLNVGYHFGVPLSEVENIANITGSLADAFMVLQMGRWTGLSKERIMNQYTARKGQGWGVIAKELGIKPGSAEFHALKNGDFGYSAKRSKKGGDNENGGPGRSNAKGKKNGRGQDDQLMPLDQTDDHGKGKGKKK
jgi:hypothetical protein